MADLGVDVFAVVDLDPAFRLVSGRVAHAQAIARRLGTPRGDLARIGDDPDYGTDLRAFVGDDEARALEGEGVAAVDGPDPGVEGLYKPERISPRAATDEQLVDAVGVIGDALATL